MTPDELRRSMPYDPDPWSPEARHPCHTPAPFPYHALAIPVLAALLALAIGALMAVMR